MGVLTSTLRMFTLQSQRSDLNYKIDLVTQAKADIAAQNAQLVTAGTDLSAESPVLKQLEARKERLHLLEKKLDQQLLQYQTQLSMVDAQLKRCSEDFNQSVKSM